MESQTIDMKQTSGQQPQQAPAVPEDVFSIPIKVPASIMNTLVAMSSENSKNISVLCVELITSALNVNMLGSGTINDFSEEAIDVLKTANLESVLEGLRIFNVAKSAVPAGDENITLTIGKDDVVFKTTSDVKDYVTQINAHRIKKGLAPLENSICELLYHYGLTLGDYSICEDVTGIPYSKFVAIFKTLGLNEREVNGAKSNMIDTGRMFNKFNIVDTPDAVAPAAIPSTETEKKQTDAPAANKSK